MNLVSFTLLFKSIGNKETDCLILLIKKWTGLRLDQKKVFPDAEVADKDSRKFCTLYDRKMKDVPEKEGFERDENEEDEVDIDDEFEDIEEEGFGENNNFVSE